MTQEQREPPGTCHLGEKMQTSVKTPKKLLLPSLFALLGLEQVSAGPQRSGFPARGKPWAGGPGKGLSRRTRLGGCSLASRLKTRRQG